MEASERMRIVVAELDEHAVLDTALRGQDAVISALGSHENGPVRVCAEGSGAIVAAMYRTGVARLVVVSAYGTRETRHRSLYSWAVWAKVAHKMRDMEAMEVVVESSGVDWTIVRPPALRGATVGTYRAAVDLPRPALVEDLPGRSGRVPARGGRGLRIREGDATDRVVTTACRSPEVVHPED